MKFPQMPYTRPQYDEVSAKLTEILEKFKTAASAEECFAAYKEYDEYNGYLFSMFAIARIRNTLDTNDEFYDKEKTYMDEVSPKLQSVYQAFTQALLDTPFRKDLEAKWGNLLFVNAEMNLKTFSPEIVPDMQEENKLRSEYSKLIASAQIKFDGKTLTLAQLRPYYENPDKAVRVAAIEAASAWYLSNAEKLDGLFDELVQIRTRMAKKLGHDNFVQLGYYRMQRNCYDANLVAKFREGVIKHIVPVAKRLKDEQAKRIGTTTPLKMHDDFFEYPEGNAKPMGTPDEIFAHGKKMYHELSEETAEFIDFMLENELFDVLTRPGKQAGGYCSHIPIYRSPFIFANFNGTSGDIDVLTHEAGHAFAGYLARDIYPSALRRYSMETAEIHSMAMEFFTWPWMEGFFGDQTQKYYYSHLASALTFIPYGTMVDEYQHHIYEKPNMSPKERNQLWLELESKYRPWLNLEGTDFYGQGRRWQSQGHIFSSPFYYIDYCLAQIMALSFWAQNQKNPSDAWAKYRRLLGFAGTKTFVELIEDAGLPSPFVPNNLKDVADAAVEWLDKQ
ncbi:MAG: M3 family oligoendopeptidase [Defluviitaleaceae bacterium]|nr:M3 family oligoendopeptidase [Defluviitaleaceae bacterium]